MNFEQKLLSMRPSEIIQAMVDGLRYPKITVRMSSFGYYSYQLNKCYGCAATNTICEISGITLGPSNIGDKVRYEALNTSFTFLDNFEIAIDALRRANIHEANMYLEVINIPTIKYKRGLYLPILNDDYTDEDLQSYEELADYNHNLEREKLLKNNKSKRIIAL